MPLPVGENRDDASSFRLSERCRLSYRDISPADKTSRSRAVIAFRSFGPTHLAALAGLTLLILALVHTGRRLSGRSLLRFERGVAFLVLALWLAYIGWDWRNGTFDVAHSLPLQLCDFVALVAGAAFVSRNRVLQALAYFWGLALSTQALITPDVAGSPTSITFAAFWLYHAFVVGAGVYVVAVHAFRPTLRDLITALALGVCWAGSVFALDLATGWNYGYLGRSTPSIPSLIDHLGPWPGRVAIMVALGALSMALFWLPWLLLERRQAQPRIRERPEIRA